MEKYRLPKYVEAALADLQKTKGDGDVFTIHEIASAIEAKVGDKLYDGAHDDIRKIMLGRWGTGVEPITIGGELWRFGFGKPPVSQEIGHRD
jgi:hypothetical protein